jgi:acylphosphatase
MAVWRPSLRVTRCRCGGVVEFCRRGPALARVDDVEAVREEYSGEFEGFSIRR